MYRVLEATLPSLRHVNQYVLLLLHKDCYHCCDVLYQNQSLMIGGAGNTVKAWVDYVNRRDHLDTWY